MLRPWTNALALPTFALFSAGVAFGSFGDLLGNTVAIGVFLGLVVGKVIGIAGGTWLTTRTQCGRTAPA
ncbi:Na+/H+ antiporter NhaA [Micromonospora sp. ATA51]|nr:Na+/H+ antiporter NhaA [Micromonospora sp. ATA51]MBM0224368.1 Na+/H+ antiporter NhaA [Micromonospora sp. ATA51]